MTSARQNLTVTKLCPTIGAEIGGVDLRNPLDQDLREQIRVLLVEHNVALVLSVCSSLYVLEFGRLIFSGPPGDAVASDALAAP